MELPMRLMTPTALLFTRCLLRRSRGAKTRTSDSRSASRSRRRRRRNQSAAGDPTPTTHAHSAAPSLRRFAPLCCTARSYSATPARSRRRYPCCYTAVIILLPMLSSCCIAAADPPQLLRRSLPCCSLHSIKPAEELVSPPRHSAAAYSHQETPN